MENRLFEVNYNEASYEEDESILIVAKDLEEAKQFALSNDWNIYYDEERELELMNAIKNFKEENLNKIDYDAIIYIVEKTDETGIIHISNKGA